MKVLKSGVPVYEAKMYQEILLHGSFPAWEPLGWMFLLSLAVMAVGCSIFNYYRDSFAELI